MNTLRRAVRPDFWIADALATALAANAGAGGPELSAADKKLLDAIWERSLREEKGPYSKNYCVCRDDAKKPVELPDGRLAPASRDGHDITGKRRHEVVIRDSAIGTTAMIIREKPEAACGRDLSRRPIRREFQYSNKLETCSGLNTSRCRSIRGIGELESTVPRS